MIKKHVSLNSLNIKSKLLLNNKEYSYYSVEKAARELDIEFQILPCVIKILLENLLRNEDGVNVKLSDINAIKNWGIKLEKRHEIFFHPARVLMQDFTGVPALVDLAALREAMKKSGKDPEKINPYIPVDLVIDHSIQVDKYGNSEALDENIKLEANRNKERYEFLRWGQKSFKNFNVIPPGMGICHQVNLEYLAKVIREQHLGSELFAYFDTLVGTDSHTTMINGLSVLGWGVGGIEAESAILGQPISMLIPEVVGVKLEGKLNDGITATDLVLTITEILRKKSVVGKFVEFYGSGLSNLTLEDRATIANMSPEYGATCGFFPVDEKTINFLQMTGRSKENIELVEAYAKKQGIWNNNSDQVCYSDSIVVDLSNIKRSVSGPKRPQDRMRLPDIPSDFKKSISENGKKYSVKDKDYTLSNGDIIISAITSCTNTSNPFVIIGAGLLARNAIKKGLKVKPWVKTSLAPGSQVVTEYLIKSGLDNDLEKLGFYTVGYGCTSCIGNSGPLLPEIAESIVDNNLTVASVLSGNRNFEGRIHPLSKANYITSPILCVAYAIAGSITCNLESDPIGYDVDKKPVYLKDIWPNTEEIINMINKYVTPDIFDKKYSNVFVGNKEWQDISVKPSSCYNWNKNSTYVKNPPFFDKINNSSDNKDIKSAKILALLGDSVTTDHISPAGSIPENSSAGQYLIKHGIAKRNFNSYGSRRGNHEVMMRGTFANIRIKNKLADGKEGGYTKYFSSNGSCKIMTIYDAAMEYMRNNIPVVVIAGKEYGTGSSRDWAAKGTCLLGVKVVIAESFERIHRSNLIGMGVLPLESNFPLKNFEFTGEEKVDIENVKDLKPKKKLKCKIYKNNDIIHELDLLTRIDTEIELEYYKNGGILNYVLKKLIAN